MMKKRFYIATMVAIFFVSCQKQEEASDPATVIVPAFGAEIASPSSSYSPSTRANGTKYGTTSYEATTFADDDVIGIFMTKHIDNPNQPFTLADIYHGYFDVGYYKATTKWTNMTSNPAQPQICVPIAHDAFDFFAYYPWAPSGKTKIVTNCDNSKQIQFAILQDQAVDNMPLCNVMRAVVRNKVFNYSDASTWTVNLQFEHILSLIEFQISRDPNSTWDIDDELLLDRVVVLGSKISTEGSFDISGPLPNVQINRTLTSKNSIFKADPTGTEVPDAVTGATPIAQRKYLRRTVIVPPVSTTATNVVLEPGDQAEVEFLIAMRWRESPSAEWEYTYRRYIAEGVTFESGKKYLFKMRVSKIETPQHPLSIKVEQSGNWDDTYVWGTTFN